MIVKMILHAFYGVGFGFKCSKKRLQEIFCNFFNGLDLVSISREKLEIKFGPLKKTNIRFLVGFFFFFFNSFVCMHTHTCIDGFVLIMN